MKKLVDPDGSVRFGIYDEPVEFVNYADYDMETPMGLPIPRPLRKLKANQFLFIGIVGPECMAGLAVANLKLAANGFFYIYDRQSRTVTETKTNALSTAANIPLYPDRVQGTFTSSKLNLSFDNGRISAQGEGISLEAKLDLEHIDPLRICTRAGYRDWVYVQKTNPVPLSGTISYGGKTIDLSSPEYYASIDWTTGYMRRKTCWNWTSISSTPDGRNFGINLSCGVNETSFTENAFWLDGKRTKVDTVNFEFDRKDLYKPWHVTSYDGKVDLIFHPEAQRDEKIHTGIIASKFTQLMGTYDGILKADDGTILELKDAPGFSEDHYAKW